MQGSERFLGAHRCFRFLSIEIVIFTSLYWNVAVTVNIIAWNSYHYWKLSCSILFSRYRGPELDAWALGVTLYTMVFRENPYTADCIPFQMSESDLPFSVSNGKILKILFLPMFFQKESVMFVSVFLFVDFFIIPFSLLLCHNEGYISISVHHAKERKPKWTKKTTPKYHRYTLIQCDCWEQTNK